MTYVIIAMLVVVVVMLFAALALMGLAFRAALVRNRVLSDALEEALDAMSAVATSHVFPDDLSSVLWGAIAVAEGVLDNDDEDDEDHNPDGFVHPTPEVARAIAGAVERSGLIGKRPALIVSDDVQ